MDARVSSLQWLIALIGLPAAYLITLLLNGILSRAGGLLLSRLRRAAPHELALLPIPARLLLIACAIYGGMQRDPPLLAPHPFWEMIASLLTIIGGVWGALFISGKVDKLVCRRLARSGDTGSTAIVHLARRLIDVLAIFLGALFAASRFGLNPTETLEALGIGGIAVALAAQKTLENILGGISIIFDRVLHEGDMLKVGDTLGTVVDVGLRSTCIRTYDRSVVSVPNGRIANLTLENLSRRDRFWFHPMLRLAPNTTSTQMQTVLKDLRDTISEHWRVDRDSVRVRFIRVAVSSLDVEIFAYVRASDIHEFLDIQGDLLLQAIKCVHAAGSQIVFQPLLLAQTPPEKRPIETVTSEDYLP